ncbi:MAG: amidoligase family protein [Pyrinomonadaceae bacterium]|nr:amidoligase family protein [Pyrinomonadaceae bacterium]
MASEHSGRVTELITIPAAGDMLQETVTELFNTLNHSTIPKLLGDNRESCGLHVHVDASDFQLIHMKNALGIVMAWDQELWDYSSSLTNRMGSRYCQNIKNHPQLNYLLSTTSIPKLMTYWRNGGDVDQDHTPEHRYWNLNIDSWLRIKTFEFRTHEATDDPDRTLAWILLCIGIMEYARQAPSQTYRQFTTRARKLSIADLVVIDDNKVLGLNGDFLDRPGEIVPPITTFIQEPITLEKSA